MISRLDPNSLPIYQQAVDLQRIDYSPMIRDTRTNLLSMI